MTHPDETASWPEELRFLADAMLERAPEEARAAAGLDASRPPVAVPQWRCPAFGRLYWEGTHTRRMRAALERVFGPAGSRTA